MELGRVKKSGSRRFELKVAELIGPPECPVMQRWAILTPLFSLRLHHFIRADDHRHPHDHPWWFITFVVKGCYTDKSIINDIVHEDKLNRWSMRFRPALHRHWVETEDAWTIVLTGRVNRNWGFWIDKVFKPVSIYFREYGYAPCE